MSITLIQREHYFLQMAAHSPNPPSVSGSWPQNQRRLSTADGQPRTRWAFLQGPCYPGIRGVLFPQRALGSEALVAPPFPAVF